MVQAEFNYMLQEIAEKLSKELQIELREDSYKTHGVFKGYGEKDFFYSVSGNEILQFYKASEPSKFTVSVQLQEIHKDTNLGGFIESTMRDQLIEWLKKNNP